MINRLLQRTLSEWGLLDKHAIVYDALVRLPGATPLQLARETKLNRSSLYRYLEDLRTKGLVELVLGDKSSSYRANPEGLNQRLVSEEARLVRLRETIPTLVQELKTSGVGGVAGTSVTYFQGVEGLKQMLWNVVSSGGEFVGLGYQDWNTSVGKVYAEKLRENMIAHSVKSREILNDPSRDFSYTAFKKEYPRIYQHRGIDPKILTIRHDTYIYGEVFAYYYHYQGELFGVEIHNREIARSERQMFEVLWKMAEIMPAKVRV